MDDLKALVLQNEFGLEQSKVMALVTGINARSVSYLSPDKEAGLFLLYVMGKTLQEIAAETSFPVDVVFLTAINYRWNQKAAALGLVDANKSTEEIQKDLLKSILVATAVTTKKALGDVIAGRADGNKSGLIPKNAQALKQLIDMIASFNPKVEPVNNGTTVHAQNVQIVNNDWKPALPEMTEEQKAKRSIMIETISAGTAKIKK